MRIVSYTFISVLIIYLILKALPIPVSKAYKEYSTTLFFHNGKLMRVYPTSDGKKRIYLPISKIDPLFIKATIAYEDKRFFYHPGVDPLAIMRALYQNIKAKRIVSGASTITLQLVRLFWPGKRTLVRKLRESIYALSIETKKEKEDILESYLNMAPYGGNIEGIGAASLYYFGKLPKNLSIGEIAFLVSLPQAPLRAIKDDIKARNRVLTAMYKAGLISKDEFLSAIKRPIPKRIRSFPFKAPHAADYIRMLYPEKRYIITGIDPTIQKLIENIQYRHKRNILESGANQSAIVVIENKSRIVRGLVGSFNYRDSLSQGQVRGFVAKRSSGSTLKPFLYALALGEGLITPETLMEDRPKTFGPFRPVNFSGKFRGMVKARNALSDSLNLPFINLLTSFGTKRFLTFLKKAGINQNKDPGLTAITGGIELTLLKLTNLYVTLVREGRYGNARLIKEEPLIEKKLIHPGAAYLTIEALLSQNHGEPNMPFEIAWKTGTSFGQRDAWAIGMSPDFTVGVWVGNFDGRGAKGIVGAKTALPLMKDILLSLGSRKKSFFGFTDYMILSSVDKNSPYKYLEWRKICPKSGLPVSNFCPEGILTLVPRDAPIANTCMWHQNFLIEADTGYLACPWKQYSPGSLVRRVFFTGPGGKKPSFPPDCGGELNNTLRILSPLSDTTYFLSSHDRYSRTLPLRAETFGKEGTIYWFTNGRLVGKSKSGETISLLPLPGRLNITAVDEKGHTESIPIWVVYVE